MAKVFYVEDDANLSFVVKDCLQIAGHDVHHFAKGDEALLAFNKFNYDICILDVMLPNLDGFSLVKAIRDKDVNIPVIFISARVQIQDKLEGLQLGGDDYIFKPFSIEELLLKVNIFLRRNVGSGLQRPVEESLFRVGHFEFDYNNMLLKSDVETIRLTGREADLLVYFIKHQNKLIKRKDILIALWGKDDYFLGRSLDVFISRLRKFIASDPTIGIENIPRVGFKFRVD
ncbi:MAG TPA: response regulator transcription factor [Saprospiraceae bacterium]|nr:response regulator transcription factor [Saprospiraceae bacterium]HMU05550.1 response regulator transcription factor [Saprospiraceae bacterium]